jgi:hypothetical protein
MAITEFSSTEPISGLILAGIFAVAGWWRDLFVTSHLLLAQIRLMVSGIAVGTAWPAPGSKESFRMGASTELASSSCNEHACAAERMLTEGPI